MAVGRITGPLLASNLRRDGVDIAFEDDLLYIDVVNGRIGIKQSSPQYELDVNTGTIRAAKLIVNTATIGLVTIESSTSSSTLSTLFGPFNITPGGNDSVYVNSTVSVRGDVFATGNFFAQGNIILGDTTGTDIISFLGEINTDILPYISSGTYVTTVTDGVTVTNFITNTNIVSDYSIGNTSSYWENAYLQNIYTQFIDTPAYTSTGTTATDIQFFPDIPLLERTINKSVTFNGDIRVYGGNPIGTFPVVNNILYVNENGSDENDGRAMDSSRACRTITGAVNSPYYKQGTIIKIAPGNYYENNPIELLPYTSVVGDSLRGVFVFPLNNADDLFHVNSGVYITGMTMRDLRRGEVTRYAPGGEGTYTTGAYCVAFPPKLDNPIDVFHSPYIQNCTNQSGPWLYDGTMFVPNQTVQIPQVVATSTYIANTTSIVVNVQPEVTAQMIKVGMAANGLGILINPDIPVATVDAIENPIEGFRSAKSLLSQNKTYIQDEIVAWVDFTYPGLLNPAQKVACRRDTGYIVDALLNDAILGGNEKIVEAGRSYYIGNTQILPVGEVPATVAAFARLKEIAIDIISNLTVTNSTGNISVQLKDFDLVDGDIATNNINSLVDLLSDIVENNGGYENAAALLNANRGFIQAETVAFVNKTYVGQPIPSFTYDKARCFTNVGLAIDALATDLLYGGNQQSIIAGQAYNGGTTILGEEDETIAGFTYLGTIVRDIILNQEFLDGYQNTVTQVTTIATGTNAAIELVERNIKIINGLIKSSSNLPTVVSNAGSSSTNVDIINSHALLVANRNFIQHEVIKYIDVSFTNLDFTYNDVKCARDTGLILDGLILDLVHSGSSQSTFAGLQYWNQGSSAIPGEESLTIGAFNYAKLIARQVVLGTPVSRMQSTVSQSTGSLYTNVTVAGILDSKFTIITDIISTGTSGVTDAIVPNGNISTDPLYQAVVDLLTSNKEFIKAEVIAWVEANKGPVVYDPAKCARDVGYIIDSVAMDVWRGGNRQSIQAGVSYFGYNSSSTVLINEIPQTVAAYKFLKAITEKVVQRITVTRVYQDEYSQDTDVLGATIAEARAIGENVDLIRSIIKKGPSAAPPLSSISLTVNTSTNVTRAYDILTRNRDFIVAEVVNYVNTTFIQPYEFKYNETKCFRDMGLIVDAIANDIIIRSNANSLEAGLAYWNGAVSVIEGQLKETSGAIQYAKNIALDVIANNPVKSLYQTTTGSYVTQNINPQLNGGGVARDLVDSNFNDITTIIENGPAYAPFSTNSTLTQFVLTLSTVTTVAATNDLMYFGYTTVFPEEDKKIPGEWKADGFADRRIDPNGSGGGALVDGNAPSRRSPIQSFVFDAFTQITQGGRGIHIINEGYAQLVSVFTIFCNIAVETDTGGIASITNSNNNFGDICLQARGYGRRKFGGTIYNPEFVAYNELTNEFEYNEFYPQGYFPESQQICVFVPSPNNRPGISLVMEVVPPDQYVNYDGDTVPYLNAQGFPGFLTAVSNTSSLTTSSYTVSGIDVTGISVGQTVYIRDQFGYEADNNGEGTPYITTGTTVTSVDYQQITLSNPILQGGGQYGNGFYFNIYACGNAYYNVLSSKTAISPYPTGQSKILGQETETIDAINYLRDLAVKVVSNIAVTGTFTTAVSQVIDTSIPGGDNSAGFIADKLGIITNVILSGPQAAPEIVTTGTKAPFVNNAIELLDRNRIFIQNEVVGYVNDTYIGFTYDESKCARDTGLIVDSIAFDMLYGGTSQSKFAGLQYWNQNGYVDAIGGQITTTTAAINYAKSLAVSIAQTAGGSGPAATVGNRFNDIVGILNNGIVGVTDLIVPNSTATNNVQIVAAAAALQSNRTSIRTQTINWINSNYPGFSYDQTKCSRDIGYIVDSVTFDLLHTGNRQSIMSGVYYYNFDGSDTAIAGEIPQTTAAYNFIKSLVEDIVTGTPVSPGYQDTVAQVTNLNPATASESNILKEKIDVITEIINDGPAGITREPIGLTASTSSNVTKAFNLLIANKNFIKAETIAYINQEFSSSFTYNEQKCRRDVGLMIDALKADLATGGNFRSVEAATTYYTKDGTYHIVTLEDNVRDSLLFVDGITVNFYQRSYQSASGYLFEYCGAGTQYGALPQAGRVDPVQSKEVVQLNNGKVFYTSTDQNGDFRIGPTLVISQATGVLSGRTFEKSLFAQMTPFILAVEAGGSE